jgi:VanZ family protein
MRTVNRLRAYRWPVLAAVLLWYWAIGFYPYQLPPYHNGAIRTAEHALLFNASGIAYTREPPGWLPEAIGSSLLRVTLEVRPARVQKSRWARIFTLSKDSHHSNLSIGQDGNDLLVQMRVPGTNPAGKPGYVIDEVFAQPGWHRIDLSVLPRLLTVAADGREVLRQRLPPNPLSNWSPEYRLAFGNQFGFNRPWLGEVRKAIVLVTGERYEYIPPDALETPASYRLPLANRYVQWIPFADYSDGNTKVVDKMVNLFGFIPFGMILAMSLRRPRSVWALAAICCAMSLSIEAGQLFLAPRTPSVDDLLLNTLGGALGAWLGLRVRLRSGHE